MLLDTTTSPKARFEEFLKRIETFKKEMEELGVDVKVTINIDARPRTDLHKSYTDGARDLSPGE